MQPLSGNQRPDLLTALMNMSLALRLPRKMHLCRSSSNVPRLPSLLEMLQSPPFCSLLTRCTIPCACPATRHLNVQKWTEPLVFLMCWLRNVLCATTAYTFSTSQLQKVLRPWSVLCILTSTCASRHNGVQFFISHLASWLRTHRFSEPTFRPSGATNHWKNTVFRDFPFRAPGSSFFWDFLFFDLLSSSLLFSSLTLPTSAFQYLSSLTSKLPSTMIFPWIPLSSQGKSPCKLWRPLARVQVACSNAWIFAVSSMSSVATRCCAVNFALPPSAGDGSVFSLPAQQGWEGWHNTK